MTQLLARPLRRILTRLALAAALVPLALHAAPESVRGNASFPGRLTLPPGAAFEATLESVADGRVLVGTRLAPAGNPPYRFELPLPPPLPSGEAPSERLLVRVRVVEGARIWFSADRMLPAVIGEAPLDLIMFARPKYQDDTLATQPELPASFEGQLPCADCAGMRWHLDLFADQTYFLRIAAVGKPPETVVDDIGRWQLGRDDRVVTLTGTRETALFQLLGSDRLLRLDRAGKPIDPKAGPQLVRLPAFDPIEPALRLSGMFASQTDPGLIRLCATGKRLPVSAEGDGAALAAAYAAARRKPGEQLLVTLDARIAERWPSARPLAERTVIVDHLDNVWPQEHCPDTGDFLPLTDIRWRLTRLDGAPVRPAPGKTGAHLILQKENSQLTGSSGCNRLMGAYKLEGAKLSFGPLAGTMMACASGVPEEEAMRAALGKVAGWKISAQHLELLDAAGTTLARFEAVTLP